LNRQISGLQGAGQLAMAFVDRRDLLIGRLSNLIDLSAIGVEDGSLTLTTSHGTALVAGEESFHLETQVDPGFGMQHIMSQGSDITATLTAGKLAGLLEVRDKVLPGFLSDLDDLAAGLTGTVNSVQRAGFDLSGTPGKDFFVPFIPADGSSTGAAASFAMSLTDPAEVAASADGASASNGNVLSLAAVRDQNIVNGQAPVAFWANLVSRLGNDISSSSAELEAEGLALEQLQNQRSAVSGVSLNEEAASLIRYQRAFEAAARVGATLNELTDAGVNSGRY
jgi:flagellar hook-associated protein 1 FlgK